MHSTSSLPPLERLKEMSPDEIGRLVLPVIARRLRNNPHGFVLRELARATAEEAGVHATLRAQYAELVSEGLGFLQRAGMFIEAPEQMGAHFLRLSRAGASAAKDPAARFSTMSGQEARTLLHSRIAEVGLGDLERGEYDKAVFSAFRELEIETRTRSGVTSSGKDTFYDAFAFKGDARGPLIPDGMEEGQARSLREFFAGSYGAVRNPSAHRDVHDDPVQAMRLLITASALFQILESLP